MFQPFIMFPQQILLKVDYNNILNETSKPPVNKTHFFNISHLLLKKMK